ncbi:hypothetical protein [Sphingobium sp.]|jgi:hypothetical protein|uniref:hypothetical protein n=1 Tax=Sphingobium sp. TaxID=1912891 RepID=UPI0035C72016
MVKWTVTVDEGAPHEVDAGVSNPVFVIKHGGKTYVSILLQDVDALTADVQGYYQTKFMEGEADPALARRVNVTEPDLVHPVNIKP